MFEDPTLPKHTFYSPKDTSGLKVPVVVWGNGGCFAAGSAFQSFLGQVASYGVLVIANGPMSSQASGQTTSAWLVESMDWVTKNGGKGNYSHVDPTRIAAWGQSCGGLEALSQAQDSRINHIGVFDSGSLSAAESTSVAGKITKPVFYFIGGSTDVAYPNVSIILTSPQFTLAYASRLSVTTKLYRQVRQLGKATITRVTSTHSLRKMEVLLEMVLSSLLNGFYVAIPRQRSGLQAVVQRQTDSLTLYPRTWKQSRSRQFERVIYLKRNFDFVYVVAREKNKYYTATEQLRVMSISMKVARPLSLLKD